MVSFFDVSSNIDIYRNSYKWCLCLSLWQKKIRIFKTTQSNLHTWKRYRNYQCLISKINLYHHQFIWRYEKNWQYLEIDWLMDGFQWNLKKWFTHGYSKTSVWKTSIHTIRLAESFRHLTLKNCKSCRSNYPLRWSTNEVHSFLTSFHLSSQFFC